MSDLPQLVIAYIRIRGHFTHSGETMVFHKQIHKIHKLVDDMVIHGLSLLYVNIENYLFTNNELVMD